MPDSNLPIRRQEGRLPAQQVRGAPIHPTTHLDFGVSTPTREELWDRLHPNVRGRAEERSGELIEWWAEEDCDGRVKAVRLGKRAMVSLTPTITARGGLATNIEVIHLNQASLRHIPVAGPVTPQVPPPTADQASTRQAAVTRQLTPDLMKMLGQLPARAQRLLQEPFLNAGNELSFDQYYCLFGNARSLSGGTLHLWCYLTDKRTVTFCSGTGLGYRSPGGAQSWALTCWRVDTAPREGAAP